jgi:putative membrane protein
VSAVIYLAANAIALLVANALLDDMPVDGSAFVIAVLIFTGVEVLVQPRVSQIAVKNANALVGSSALIATLIGLIVTVTRQRVGNARPPRPRSFLRVITSAACV